MERGLSKKSNILSVNVYIYIYCVVNIVVHSDTVLWCQPLIVCCLCVFVMLIYILFTAVRCQPLIVCCLSVFVRLICTLYSCVLSTFNCMLSLWFCHVYVYYMKMCAVNIWLYVVCVLLLCLYIYICFTAEWCTPSFVVCVLLVCLYVLNTAVICQPLIVCCLTVFVRLICTLYNMISKNMINLCSLNVNGIHGREKRNRVVEWIKTQKCSIVFFTGNSFRWK
jgi:hypothetical protein